MSKQLAVTIINQIKCGATESNPPISGVHAMMCWGLQKTMIVKEDADSLGGVIFAVSGFHHKGLVKITLAFNDTYSVEFLTFKRKLVKSFYGVYCDQLTAIIDSFVESNSNNDHKAA